MIDKNNIKNFIRTNVAIEEAYIDAIYGPAGFIELMILIILILTMYLLI